MVNYEYVSPDDHLSTLSKAQLKKKREIEQHWKYYKGEYPKSLKPKTLPNGLQIDDSISLNLLAKVVNKGNNFLFGKGLTWQLSETKKTVQEQVLEDIWGNQETQTAFLSELGIGGGVSGDWFVQIVSEDNNISLKSLDSRKTFVTTDPKDVEKEIAFDLRWEEDVPYRLLHKKLNDEQWDFATERWEKRKWITVIPTQVWPFNWPFIVHGKNLPNPYSYHGLSDIADPSINLAINQVSSNINRIVRIFAHPVIWGTGFGANSLDVDSSKVITTTNESAKLAALELARDLSGSQDYLKFLRTMLSEISNVPESDPDRLAIGAQSGFALEVLFNDLILKTGIKRSFYGKGLIELNRRLLELAGFGPDNQTKLYWPNPLPIDKSQEKESDQFELEAELVSRRTVSTKRGYDYDIEQEKRGQETVSRTSLGEAIIQSFGTN